MTTIRICTLVAALALSTVASAQRTRLVPRQLYPYPVYSYGPLDLETADLDGDGFTDIAAGAWANGAVSVLTNRLQQSGQFAQTHYLPPGSADVEELALGDLDGDGSRDIVIAIYHHDEFMEPSVYFNRGNGSFAPPVSYPPTALTGLVCADVELDGDVDVVSRAGTSIRVYPNQGDGTLAAPLQQSGTCSRVQTATDLDQDGAPDLVTTDFVGQTLVKVFLNPGDGSFATSTSYAVAGPVNKLHVETADLDGDGDLDVVTDNGSVLRNLGDGTFAPAEAHDIGASEGNDLTIADLDGDRLPDLVVAVGETFIGGSGPGGLAILPNLGDGAFGPPAMLAFPFGPYRLTSADFDHDGDIDLVPTGMRENAGVYLLMNRGDGTFPAPEHQGPGPSSSSLTAADQDGDGDADLVTAGTDSLSVYWNVGNASFPTRVDVTVPTEGLPRPITSVDLDGDGDQDLVTPNESGDSVAVVENLGSGDFLPYVAFATGDRPVGVAAGDMDDDGLVDLATADRGAGTVSLLRNSGSSFAPPVSYSVGTGEPRSLVLADLDDDGDLDLAAARYPGFAPTYPVAVFLNAGDGSLGAPATFSAHGYYPLVAVDLDGDSDVDLLSGRVSVLTNHGDATFDAPVLYGSPTSTSNSADFSCADLDDDGDPDLVSGGTGRGPQVFFNRGDGRLRWPPAAYWNPGSGITAGDLDGDGDMDLARTGDGVSVMRNQLRKPR